jgi:uncharacterized protein involved in exopolysaccharide biosynthesis
MVNPSFDDQSRGREPAPTEQESADIFDYVLIRQFAGLVFRAPARHKLLASACFLGVVLAAVVALMVLPKRFQVQGTMLVQRSPVMGSLSNPGLNREGDAPTRAARELVLRRDNLISLCRQTDFVRRYQASRAPVVRLRDWVVYTLTGKERTEAELLEDLADTLETRLWVMVTSEGAVTINFEWSNAELAYHVVEAAMQNFLEARHAAEISIVSETVTILEAHAARVQKDIAEMVPQLEEKERRLRGTTAPRRTPVARPRVARDEELARVESTLAARRRALADLEEFRQRRLAELQGQLSQQTTLYAPQHPAVVSTRQTLAALTAPSPQIEGLRVEIRDLEREVTRRGGLAGVEADATADFRSDLTDWRARGAEDDPRVEYERGQLRLLFRQYSSLVDRLDLSRVELDTARAAFKHRYSVITPPQIPKRPIRPNPPMVFMGSLIGGVLLAFFASAAADLWSGRIVETWQVERRLRIPVLAELGE